MPQPVLSPAALRDFDQILDYLIQEAGPNVAAKYRRSFMHLFALLGDHPALGASRSRLGRQVRLAVIAPYLVLYRYQRDTVTVLRILHGRRRITGAMLRRTP
jgi:toxin ParE1/3/4